MKVGFISYWSCPLTRLGILRAGGMNVYIVNLANQLGKLGVAVDIYTRSHKDKHAPSTIRLFENVNLIHLPVQNKDDYLAVLNFARIVSDYIDKKNLTYDLFHSHYYFSGLSALILKTKFKIPFIQTFHTLGEMKKRYVGLSDISRIKAEKQITIISDALIASTQLEKNHLEKYYKADPGKIHVITPGVNHHLFRPHDKIKSRRILNLPLNKKIVLFVGRIDPVKGLTFLIRAVGILTRKYPDFKESINVLLIGGDINSRYFWHNKEVKKIVRLIKIKKLSGCVNFLGSVSHNKLPRFYSSADVVVLPSFYESFGLVVLEAMACGSAVLSSAVGGVQYLIRDGKNGIIFRSGNVADLSWKLYQLINNPGKRESLGKNAVYTGRNLCWEKQADKMKSLYEKIAV
ncbi:hypothetical protein A3I80_01290 [Candidatus Gottesmanbacteria bacterium RIFCSPLOWO2_02_FULL_40_10]|nr:MAG: hypothetical protein A3I80_01290 [Candidatus Gottesmanbacteria bacterium RIFCSPLOWO2_02_FULL_40_10]